ncbi:MAG TPA: MASE1 domain-containing protein [Woeseiaceae bacterium]|nr:MASE1 domain-containing protein [Woeseiaceae bacterium]
MPQGRRFAPLNAVGLMLIGVAYFVVAYLGLQLASINPSATPIWPATGLAIAAILAWDYRVAPAIFIAAFLVNYVTAGSAMTAAAIGLGNTLEGVATAYLVKLWAGGLHVFESPAGVGKFALISAATTTISATTGVGSLAIAGYAETGKVGAIWLTWWLGDLAGAVVITPMVLLWIVPQATRPSFRETALVYGAATAIGIVAFSPLLPQTGLRDPLGFLAVGPLLWAALRCGPRDTATVAAILATFAVWGTLMEGGPFARANLNQSFLLLLMFLISTAIPSLALSADISGRQRAHEQQQLLLRELSHRVGNSLAVLNSVFRRSARHASSIADLEEAFQGRLMSLAATHRLLGESNWESASMLDLVRAAVDPYCPSVHRGCTFEGGDVRIPGSLVTSITMVLHELATNAARHGALKSPLGQLKVSWRCESDCEGCAQLHVNWDELGAGRQQNVAGNAAGYGTALIDSTIATLGGRVTRSSGRQGYSVRLSVPLGWT